jgi:hypothetical protein
MTAENRNTETKRQPWRDKHVSGATNKHVTIEEFLEKMFSKRSVPRLYSVVHWEKLASRESEVGGRSWRLLV